MASHLNDTAENDMSRINNEADRAAFNSWEAKEKRNAAINEWLKKNPQIGVLNNGMYYIIENGEQVFVSCSVEV